MTTVAKWITKNGNKIYLRKGGAGFVHDDFYRIEGNGVSGMHGQPLHVLDRKHALEIAKANVRTKNFRYDTQKYGFDHARKIKDRQRVDELHRKIIQLMKERNEIHANYNKSKLNRLDEINHSLPYLRTEIENLGGRV